MNRKNLDPLNILWTFLILTGFIVACGQTFFGEEDTLSKVLKSTFDLSKLAFEISIGLTGLLCLWMGLMKVGEEAGFVRLLTKLFRPLFSRILPGVPSDHPAIGSITVNMASNMLGLDNAATPSGLKAMKELQELNPNKSTASNEQIVFLVLNASSVTLIPTTIFAYRAQQGAANPTDIFIPILVATFVSTLVGFISVSIIQKIRLWDKVILGYLGSMTALVAALILYFSQLPTEEIQRQSSILSSFIILSLISGFIVMALWNKVNVYSTFVEGAKGGFEIAITIIPYLVAMLVAIGVFRSSGAMDYVVGVARTAVELAGVDSRFVDGLPTAFLKPLSGGGSRAMMFETMKTFGADSFAGRLASTLQGSTETTFYVLAVYYGSVGIQKIRHSLFCGLLSDAAGAVAAIFMCYLFFG